MKRWRPWAALLAASATACGAVSVPEEHLYRLVAPQPSAGAVGFAGALRVERLELAAHLATDALLVAEGPVAVRPYRLHRWAGPLDALITDGLRTGLRRGHAFARVLGPGDPGTAALSLTGRVLDCAQVAGAGGWAARLAIELRLVDEARGDVVFDEEVAAEVPVPSGAPDDVVRGLSAALADVVDTVLARCGDAGLLELEVDAAPGR